MATLLSAVAALALVAGLVFVFRGDRGPHDRVFVALCGVGSAIASGLAELASGWRFPWVRVLGEGITLTTLLYIGWEIGSPLCGAPQPHDSLLRVLRFGGLFAAGASVGAWSFLELGAGWGFMLSGLAILFITIHHLVASRDLHRSP